MSQSSRITRVASAIGVGGIAVLAVFIPTGAFGEPPNAPPGVDLGAALNGNVQVPTVDLRAAQSNLARAQNLGAARNGNVHVAPVDLGAARNDVDSEVFDVRGLLKDIERPLPAYVEPIPYSPPAQVLVDDNSVELLQLALGAAVGTAITAAGLAALTARNRRRAAHPTS